MAFLTLTSSICSTLMALSTRAIASELYLFSSSSGVTGTSFAAPSRLVASSWSVSIGLLKCQMGDRGQVFWFESKVVSTTLRRRAVTYDELWRLVYVFCCD